MTAKTPARRLAHAATLLAGAPPDRVFPLLCPVREYDWIDGWSCRLVHSESGVVEQGCIFETDGPPEGRTIWVTTVHDAVARRVEFVRVSPESHVSRMALAVEPEGAAGARVQVRYELTALNARGEALLAHLEATGALAARAARLGGSLDHYLRTGTMLRRAAAG